MIGDDIIVTVIDIRGDRARLGITAPANIDVHRQEIYERIQKEAKTPAPDNRLTARSSSDELAEKDWEIARLRKTIRVLCHAYHLTDISDKSFDDEQLRAFLKDDLKTMSATERATAMQIPHKPRQPKEMEGKKWPNRTS